VNPEESRLSKSLIISSKEKVQERFEKGDTVDGNGLTELESGENEEKRKSEGV